MKYNRSLTCFILAICGVFFSQFSFGQERIPLNKHKRPIKDISKYEPYYFRSVSTTTPNLRTERTFDLDSSIVLEKVEYLGKKGEILKYATREYDQESGMVVRTYQFDNLKKSSVDSLFHLNGTPKGIKKTTNGQLLEEKRWDEFGNPLDVTLFKDAAIPGGAEAWYKFLGSNIKYPAEARNDKAEGTVYIVFQLDTEGKMSEFEVMNPEDVHPALSNEALRVLKKYPNNWSPKVENGVPVSTEMFLPIRFKL